MRVPLSKVWRGFPELDRFSDQQCAAYVRVARERRGRLVLLWMVCGTVFLFGFPVLLVAGVVAAERLTDMSSRSVWPPVVWLGVFVVAPAVPLVVNLWIRDRWLRRAIRAHLSDTRCPSCRYVLIGLPVSDGALRCPECGLRITLDSIGLCAADLVAPTETGGPARS